MDLTKVVRMRAEGYAAISLVMGLLVVVIATGAIALIDPFGSGEPWLIWISLMFGGVLGLFFSLGAAVLFNEEAAHLPDYRLNMIFTFIAIAAVVGIFTMVIAIFSPHAATVWGGYAAMLAAYALNSWFMSRAHNIIESERKRVY